MGPSRIMPKPAVIGIWVREVEWARWDLNADRVQTLSKARTRVEVPATAYSEITAGHPIDSVGTFVTKVNGLSVAYQRVGDGPALVLLHGFTQDSRVWRPQLESLSDQFTVIAWDAPGAGRSPDPPETFGIGDWADCLAGLLEAIGVQRAHVLGLSWGGLLAQELYRRHSAPVISLVLADTYAGWKGSLSEPIPEERLAACLRDSSLPPSEFVPRYLPGMLSESPKEEVREELASIMSDFHPVGFRLMATALAQADTRDLLPSIRVPTLLIWGGEDTRSPMSVAYQIRDLIPGARLAVIPGAGHDSNLEEPARFNTIVRDFCTPLQPK